MLILVDFDNLHNSIIKHGIVHTIGKIISKIDPSDLALERHVKIRLYGGWYLQNNITTKAQLLSADISNNFPNAFLLSDSSTNVIVNCEIAYSILADPTNHLFDTYRQKGIPLGLKAHHPSSCNCTNANCPIVTTYDFLANKKCGACNTISPEDIFYRGEQKLVDTMITSDLLFSNSLTSIAIVSSDDDFWPGIKTSLVQGKKVIHLHTRNRLMPSSYTSTTTTNYYQRQL